MSKAERTQHTGDGAWFSVHRGVMAYLDTFSGLVPCRVESVDDAGNVTVKLTGTRGAYKRGETLTGQRAGLSVVPRTAVFVRSGRYVISGLPTRAIPDSALGH